MAISALTQSGVCFPHIYGSQNSREYPGRSLQEWMDDVVKYAGLFLWLTQWWIHSVITVPML